MGNVTYKNYINGAWVESTSGRTVPNLNPANTNEVLGHAPASTREEAQAAIRAAHEAFPAWRATAAPARGRIIYQAMELMIQRKEELATMLTHEEGKLLSEARGEVQRSINILEYMAGEGRRMPGETVPSELPNTFCYTVREPLGVVALITPWNFPVAIPVWKIAPALVAGNTAIFKPASLTPGTAQMVVKIFEDAGLPRGVLNMVIGSGGTVGDELVNNPAVRAVSFTGSNDIGSKLYDQVAARGCRAQCEMGGKNPVVVMEDCDFNLAVEGTVQGAFGSTGQR
ncbi:MAG: aldehyde dehydrogenase family protein, partial [Deinococcus sp.]|nr:aldehyde dehydrogenase family protein [Deinococcus sp.]